MIMVFAVFAILLGVMYATPGALPVAADWSIRYARIIVGGGLVASGSGYFLASINATDIGFGAIVIGHALFAWAIFRQPC